MLISVSGGAADFETSGGVEVDIVDFDNLKADGLCFEERDAEYQRMRHWLATGELVPAASDSDSE